MKKITLLFLILIASSCTPNLYNGNASKRKMKYFNEKQFKKNVYPREKKGVPGEKKIIF